MPIASSGGARISRRLVTHNHQRKDFETLLADARTHFETLSRTPDDLLRHIGSPFAPDQRSIQSQERAASSTWKHLASINGPYTCIEI